MIPRTDACSDLTQYVYVKPLYMPTPTRKQPFWMCSRQDLFERICVVCKKIILCDEFIMRKRPVCSYACYRVEIMRNKA